MYYLYIFLLGVAICLTGCGNSVSKTDEITIVGDVSTENDLETMVEEVNTEDDFDSIPFSVLADLSSLKLSQVETTTISIVTEVTDWDYYVETENGKISNKLSASFDYTRSGEEILKDTITIYFTDKEAGKSYKYTIPLFFKNFSERIHVFPNPS